MKKTAIIILIIISIVFVSNFSIFAPQKANATAPVSVVADVDRTWDKIAIYVWKVVGVPLFKKFVMKVITGGDFKMSWSSVKSWLINDLAFQTLDATLRAYTGYSLCIDVKINIQLALRDAIAPDYQPLCRPEDSKIWGLADALITEGGTAAWKKLEEEYYQSFFFNLTSQNNDVNQWYAIQDNAEQEKNKKQQHIYLELLANDGVLGKRQCPPDYKGDPDDCPIMSPGSSVSEFLKTEFSSVNDTLLQTTIKEDIFALTGSAVQLLLTQSINSAFEAAR